MNKPEEPGAGAPLHEKDDEDFFEVIRLIAVSREKAYQAVNTALIDLYWQVGSMISLRIKAAEWGDGVVDRLATFIIQREPGLRGFTRRNLFRMRSFFDTCENDLKVRPLVAQLSLITSSSWSRANGPKNENSTFASQFGRNEASVSLGVVIELA